MEGDRVITLMEPGPPVINEYGERVAGATIDRRRWVLRRDRGGRDEVDTDTVIGEWSTVFRVRMAGVEHMTQAWTVLDERGVTWDIERIAEVDPPRKRWWLLYCVARS